MDVQVQRSDRINQGTEMSWLQWYAWLPSQLDFFVLFKFSLLRLETRIDREHNCLDIDLTELTVRFQALF